MGRSIHTDKAHYTIIGVSRDAKAQFIGEDPKNTVYLQSGSTASAASSFFGTSILVKTAGNPRSYEQRVRGAIASLNPNMAVFNVETMDEHVSKSLLLPRILGASFGVFSAVGLGLAAIGLFAVMSYWVRCRVREIGIRMAVGARPGAVLKMVLRQGLTMTGVGLAIGMTLVLLLGRSMARLLYGIQGTDLTTCAGVAAVLLVTATVATVVPASRAARVQPSTALRQE